MSSKSVKILVVEDDPHTATNIATFLSELGYDITAIVPSAEAAVLQLTENHPDLVLLDIQLNGGMDGIELGHILQDEHEIPVLFLTANADDATFNRAKEAKPYAFLPKPIVKLDLKRALELTLGLLYDEDDAADEEDASNVLDDRIFVRYKERMVKIMLDTILFVEAERNYCRVVTHSKEYLLTMPMKSLEDKLPTTHFQRIHRSHIVNMTHVDEVAEGAVIIGQKVLPLSKSLREEFLLRIRTV
jgi:DNA-binding LytR/AlgR family response regulator